MKSELDQRMKRFEQVCREADVKITHQRMQIFRELAKSGDHPDAESVFLRVKKRMPTISLDTVYRALWLFNDLGLIKTLDAQRERTRFDANLNQHHHFVCNNCGMMRDIYSEEFDKLKLPENLTEIGQASSTHVEVRGICIECVKKNNMTRKN